jgi:outer membrane biogenesis lipoprotein LolB
VEVAALGDGGSARLAQQRTRNSSLALVGPLREHLAEVTKQQAGNQLVDAGALEQHLNGLPWRYS